MLEVIVNMCTIISSLAVVATIVASIKQFRLLVDQNEMISQQIKQDREIAKFTLDRQKRSIQWCLLRISWDGQMSCLAR